MDESNLFFLCIRRDRFSVLFISVVIFFSCLNTFYCTLFVTDLKLSIDKQVISIVSCLAIDSSNRASCKHYWLNKMWKKENNKGTLKKLYWEEITISFS